MRELAFCSGFPDHSLLIGLTLGLPALGWSCKAPTMRVRIAELQVSLKNLEEGADEHNAKIIRSTKPSGDASLDMASWLKTMEEVNANVVLGPFRHFGRGPFKLVRLLRRSALGVARRADGAQVRTPPQACNTRTSLLT